MAMIFKYIVYVIAATLAGIIIANAIWVISKLLKGEIDDY